MPNLKPLAITVLDKIGISKRSVDNDNIRYGFGDETYTIATRINFPSDGEIIIYSNPDFKMPEPSRQKTMEYINRKNFTSKIGCIELDIRDGEVRFRTSLRHGEATDVESIIGAMIGLHHTYFARDIYPNLKILSDPNDTTSVDDLVSRN
jgi:hypothetical protein